MSQETSPAVSFDNTLTSELPEDPETSNHRRQVERACFSRVLPKSAARPRLVAYSPEVAELLDFSSFFCDSEEFVQVFSGNQLMPGMDPYAACYGGHQFGAWAGQLGDGRAINLGEIVNKREERWTLQLKGAGPTPYSRGADGLAVLRSSLREFLCSEAMHHLGVPTTRALSLILTGENVVRDMFYDGNPKPEPGAVVCRVAPSFTRFGNFQIHTARREFDVLRQLVDYTIRTDFPHLGAPEADVYVAWFEEVCRRTVDMINHWLRVGFVHGVMNTDNMSILGLTIDYGPYGWLEDFDVNWTPNTTDASGRRYRFGNQSQIALWNLVQLAQAISPLFEDIEPLKNVLEEVPDRFQSGWRSMMAAKLGLEGFIPDLDDALMSDLISVLQLVETDMTIFFRALAAIDCSPGAADSANDEELFAPLTDAYYEPAKITVEHRARIADWLRRYRRRAQASGIPEAERRERMNAVNPKYVLRNYLAQLAIDKVEEGDMTMVHELLDVLRHPYDEQPKSEHLAAKRPEWARHRPGCSMLSCSS